MPEDPSSPPKRPLSFAPELLLVIFRHVINLLEEEVAHFHQDPSHPMSFQLHNTIKRRNSELVSVALVATAWRAVAYSFLYGDISVSWRYSIAAAFMNTVLQNSSLGLFTTSFRTSAFSHHHGIIEQREMFIRSEGYDKWREDSLDTVFKLKDSLDHPRYERQLRIAKEEVDCMEWERASRLTLSTVDKVWMSREDGTTALFNFLPSLTNLQRLSLSIFSSVGVTDLTQKLDQLCTLVLSSTGLSLLAPILASAPNLSNLQIASPYTPSCAPGDPSSMLSFSEFPLQKLSHLRLDNLTTRNKDFVCGDIQRVLDLIRPSLHSLSVSKFQRGDQEFVKSQIISKRHFPFLESFYTDVLLSASFMIELMAAAPNPRHLHCRSGLELRTRDANSIPITKITHVHTFSSSITWTSVIPVVETCLRLFPDLTNVKLYHDSGETGELTSVEWNSKYRGAGVDITFHEEARCDWEDRWIS